MAKLLLNLRNVGDDEYADVCTLLDQHGIAWYRTEPSPWGISNGGLWLREDTDHPRAKALMAEYQAERGPRIRAEREQALREGTAETFGSLFRRRPVYVVLVLLAAVFVLAANTLLRPVVNRIQRQPLPEAFSEATYAINVVCQREQQAEVLDQLLLLLEQAHYPVRAVDQRPFGERDVEIEAVLYATTVDAGELDAVLATLATTPGVLQGFWNASLEE